MAKKPYKDILKISANIMIDPELKRVCHARFNEFGFRSFSELVSESLTQFLAVH